MSHGQAVWVASADTMMMPSRSGTANRNSKPSAGTSTSSAAISPILDAEIEPQPRRHEMIAGELQQFPQRE
jgi:hypothetical protein